MFCQYILSIVAFNVGMYRSCKIEKYACCLACGHMSTMWGIFFSIVIYETWLRAILITVI